MDFYLKLKFSIKTDAILRLTTLFDPVHFFFKFTMYK